MRDSIKPPRVKKIKGGFVKGESFATGAGIYKYRKADGSIQRELRHPDDVFDEESLKSLKLLSVTLEHPKEFIDANNAHKYDVGSTGENYRIEGNLVAVTLIIRHQEAIDAINDGKHEISMGYTADVVPGKGTYNGEEYDVRQINIVYNHLAIVDKGRAGSEVSLRFDSAAVLIEEEPTASDNSNQNNDSTNNVSITQEEETKTMKEKEETKNTDNHAQFRIDSLSTELKALKAENTALQIKLDSAQIKLDSVEKELAQEKESKSESVIQKQVMDRADIVLKAAAHLDDIKSFAQRSDREIMVEVMNKNRTDAIDFSNRNDDFIRGAFDNFVSTNASHRTDSKSANDNAFGLIQKRRDSAQSMTIHDQLMEQLKK